MTPACRKSGAAVSIREDVAVTGDSKVGERCQGDKEEREEEVGRGGEGWK